MNSDNFTLLTDYQKTEAVLKGTFLAERLAGNFYVRLYNLHNFYVEVFFEGRQRLITKFRAFEHTLFVLPYLDDIQLKLPAVVRKKIN
jgi:hypothetical protein